MNQIPKLKQERCLPVFLLYLKYSDHLVQHLAVAVVVKAHQFLSLNLFFLSFLNSQKGDTSHSSNPSQASEILSSSSHPNTKFCQISPLNLSHICPHVPNIYQSLNSDPSYFSGGLSVLMTLARSPVNTIM